MIFSLKSILLKLLLFLIISLAFVLRFYHLDKIPAGFFADEASFGFNAWTISQNLRDEYGHFLPLYFRAFDDYKSPLSIYLAVPIIKVFGLSVESVRLVGAIFGTLTVLVLYFVAKKIFGSQPAGLLTAFLLAISPWHLQFSRSGLWDIVIFPLFFLIALYFTIAAFEGKSKPLKNWLLAFVFWGLTVYSYNVARITVPLMVIGILVIGFRYGRFNFKKVGLSLLFFLLIARPSYWFLFQGGANRWNQVSLFTIKEDSSARVVRFVTNYFSHFSFSFLFEKGENSFITRHAVLGMGELYLWQLPLVLIGVISLIRSKDFSKRLVLLSLVLYPLGAALSSLSPSASRAFFGSVIFPIITVEGLRSVNNFLAGRKNRFWELVKISGSVVLAFAILALFICYLLLYYRFYPLQSSDFWGWQYGSQEIAAYFKEHQKDYDELVMSSQFNEPAYFFKFFEKETPCPNCLVGDLENLDLEKKQLFALAPSQIPTDYLAKIRIKKRVLYADGKPAFWIFEL